MELYRLWTVWVTFALAGAFGRLNITAGLVLAAQGLLLRVELENFLVAGRQIIKDNLEPAVEAVNESLVVQRLVDDSRDNDRLDFVESLLSKIHHCGCRAVFQHVGGTFHQAPNGWLFGLAGNSQ